MNFIITESQLRAILNESREDGVISDLKIMKDFSKNVINITSRIYKLNLQFLSKFGTALGGLMIPLDNYIRGGEFKLTDSQMGLILVGIIVTYYLDHKESAAKIHNLIRQEGIMPAFKYGSKKAKELKRSFSKFIFSLRGTAHTFAEMVSYAFLIPIVQDIVAILNDQGDIETTAALIAKRMVTSGLVLGSAITITELITRAAKKISK